jgi:hypothetical protein
MELGVSRMFMRNIKFRAAANQRRWDKFVETADEAERGTL